MKTWRPPAGQDGKIVKSTKAVNKAMKHGPHSKNPGTLYKPMPMSPPTTNPPIPPPLIAGKIPGVTIGGRLPRPFPKGPGGIQRPISTKGPATARIPISTRGPGTATFPGTPVTGVRPARRPTMRTPRRRGRI